MPLHADPECTREILHRGAERAWASSTGIAAWLDMSARAASKPFSARQSRMTIAQSSPKPGAYRQDAGPGSREFADHPCLRRPVFHAGARDR